jgi:hypothetical protein
MDKPKCSQCKERDAVVKGRCQRCYMREYSAAHKKASTALVPATPAVIEPVPQHVLEMPAVHLVARNPAEMQAAQLDLAAWLRGKLRSLHAEIEELSAALNEAARNGWRMEPLQRQLNKADQEERYYQKMLLAVEAGYTIVPEFPIDVFAIRVKRKHVTGDIAETNLSYHNPANDIAPQRSDLPCAGEGRYESPTAKMRGGERKEDDGKGGQKLIRFAFTDDWGDIVFPLRAARPAVMNATAQAMALKVFDQIGICQPVRNAGVMRAPDPLIIGQILGHRRGWTQKCASFIIAWYLNVEDL